MKASPFPFACIIFTFVMANVSSMAEEIGATAEDSPPTYETLYSSTGNESLKLECSGRRMRAFTCHFDVLRFKPASPKNRLETWQTDWDNLTDSAREDVTRQTFSPPEDKQRYIENLQRRLSNPSLGPKAKLTLQQELDAAQAEDIRRHMTVTLSREARTCSAFTQSLSLNFREIGPSKWVSNPGPEGNCKVIKIYELTRHDGRWSMNETYVTAGKINGSFCEGLEEDLGKTTTWNSEPLLWEPSCDFIRHSPRNLP